MNKKVAKAIAIVLCMLMAISMAACATQGGAASTQSAAATQAPTQAATQAPTEAPTVAPTAAPDPFGKFDPPITINIVQSLDSNEKFDTTNPDRKSLTENIWATAYAQQLGIKLNYEWTPNPDQYDSKWNVSIASGDIPDMATVDATIYKSLLAGNLVQDMTQAYNDYASDQYKQTNKDDGGVTIKYMSVNGKLMGLPLTGSQYDNLNFLFVRKDWLQKVGMTDPKTIDDLDKVAKAFMAAKLGGDGTYGICMGKDIVGGQNDMEGFLNGFGSYYNEWIKDSSGNLVYSTIQPETKTALLKLQQMYKDGLLAQDFAVKDDGTIGKDVGAGKVGIAYGTFWAPLGSMMASYQGGNTADWDVMEVPTVDGSPSKSQGSSTPGGFIFVKNGYAHPEAAVRLVNLDLKLQTGDPLNYSTAADTFPVFKYRFSQIFLPWKNLNMYIDIAAALSSGDTTKMTPETKSIYDMVVSGKRDNLGYVLVFGNNSTYQFVNDMKTNDRIVVDAYQALPTDTMTEKGSTLKTNLDAAMLKVIMGADISTFDTAVTAWQNEGGNTITQEVNAWYASNK